jgi:hypothetical protein
VNLCLDKFLHEIDKNKHLDEDFFLDVPLENPIDIEFAKVLDEKKKLFKELRNKLGSTEDGTKNLIKSIKDDIKLLIPHIESSLKCRRMFNSRRLIVSDLPTIFKKES